MLELGLELRGGSRQRRGTMQIGHSDDDDDDKCDDDDECDDDDGDDDDEGGDKVDDADDDDDDLHNPSHPLGHSLLLLVNAIITSCCRFSQDVEGHVR